MHASVSARARMAARRTVVTVGTIAAVLAMATTALASTSVTKTIVSRDRYTNTSSFHKTQVEPDTFSWGSTIVGTFQTGRFTDGGSSNLGWATSTDNGMTWTHGFLPKTTVYANPPGPWDRISDPAVAYDAKDDVWMIEGLTLTGATGEDVIISRSTDGGLTWGNPVTAAHNPGTFFDKSWVACDDWSGSPNYGNCYVEYDDAGSGDVMKMVRSTDGGQTWAAASVPSAFGLGGQPLALPDGTVVVPYAGNGIDSLVSTDGGKTYSVFHVASVQERGPAGNLRSGGGLPSAEVDAGGKVYVVWFDCRFRSGCATDDIVMSTSTDGKNWSSVVRIPIDGTSSGVEHMIPGIGVDRSTQGNSAHLGLSYYFYPSNNCTSSTCQLTVGYISSTDGGSTWSTAVKVAGPMKLTRLPLTNQGYMVGDYMSTSILGNGKADTVFSFAAKGACTLGQVKSCKDFMYAPTAGLPVSGGTNPVGHHVLWTGNRLTFNGTRTAF